MTEFERPLPKNVRKYIERLKSATGCDPVVTRPSTNRITLVVANERVEVTTTFKGRNGGWAGTTLKVDGVERESADNEEDLRRIWNDPDLTGGIDPGKLPAIPPPPDDLRDVPVDVRQHYNVLCTKFGDFTYVGYDEQRQLWIVGIDFTTGGIMFFFSRSGRRWQFDEYGPFGQFQMVRDGVNVTSEAAGRIDKALAMLTSASPHSAPEDSGTIGGAAPSARSNSVETRRMVVIRELSACADDKSL